MKTQLGRLYSHPENKPTRRLVKEATIIDVYQRMQGYEIYQKHGDANWQRMQMTRDQANNLINIALSTGFTEA